MTDDPEFERRLRAALARDAGALPMRVDAETVKDRLASRRAVPSWLLPLAAPVAALVAAAVVVAVVLLNAFPGGDAGLEPGGPPTPPAPSRSAIPTPTADPTPGPTQHPAARTDAAVASVEGTLVLAGGSRGSGALRSVVLFDGRVWTELPPLPEQRSGAAGVLLPDGTLLVAGGVTAGLPLDSALLLEPGGDTWTEAEPMPHPQAHMGAALVNGRAYFFGGSVAEQATAVLVYDPVVGTWSSVASMPAPLSRVAAAALDGAVMVVGGRSEPDGADTSTAMRYDVAADSWETLAPMPRPGSRLSAVPVDGRVWVIGIPPTELRRPRVLVFDVAAGAWSERQTPGFGRGTVAVLMRNGIILVIATQPGITVSSIDTRAAPPP